MLSARTLFAALFVLFVRSVASGQHAGHRAGMENISYDSVSVEAIAGEFVSPLQLLEAPDGTKRLFVVDQVGKIYIIKNGKKLAQPFLSITRKIIKLNTADEEERGLLGLAFHPHFKHNGKFYVYYSAPAGPSAPRGWDHANRVAEFKVSENADVADSVSERILLQIDHPQMNHNAGMLAFGPDGYLYISVGDGGGADDTYEGHTEDWYDKNKGGNAQNLENLLGKILRIDVNKGNPYGIPADNPFIKGGGRKEIFAFGLRNPYRFCFDPATGKLILADAGQELFEEIDVITKGGNYGWNVKEGRHCFNAANDKQPAMTCPNKDAQGNLLIDPVVEFKNTMSFEDGLGVVCIGGVVYRGGAVNHLTGKYLFGFWTKSHDMGSGAVYAATQDGNSWSYKKLWIKGQPKGSLNLFLLGFGQDLGGEVYLLASNKMSPTEKSGRVLKIIRPKPGMDEMNMKNEMPGMDHAVHSKERKKPPRIGPVVEYHLYVNDTTVNFTGRSRRAIAINGQIPAPALHFTEGDSAVIHVHNRLKHEVSIHWHGVLLPNEEDGVAALNTPPIHEGHTHTFRFRIIQHGTLWYHSHTMLQEQEGLYGPLVFHPADPGNHKGKNEEVLQISDWRDERGSSIMRTLKRRNEWYAIKKKAVQSWGEAIVKGHFGDKVQMEWTRMPGADVSDVYYPVYLIHGQPARNFEKYKKGDSVRLRIINGSAASYFWLQYSGGKMRVIGADGNDVSPVEVDKLLIATAETYDVVIRIPADGQYEFRATAQDITGYASAYFGSGDKIKAKDIPRLDYMVLMNEMNKMTWMMKGMGMKMRMGLFMKMPEMAMDHGGGMDNMEGMEKKEMPQMDMDHDSVSQEMKGMPHDNMKMNDTVNIERNKKDMKPMDHSNMPGMEKNKQSSKKPSPKKPATKKKTEKKKQQDKTEHSEHQSHGKIDNNFSKEKKLYAMDAERRHLIKTGLLTSSSFIVSDIIPQENKQHDMPMPGHDMKEHRTRDTVPKKSRDKEVDMQKMQHDDMQMGDQKDTSRSFMLMNMMPKMKLTGFDFPPGDGSDVVLSYDMLRSDTGQTALSRERPWREINLTLSGNMQRFVWSINGKTLSQQDEKVKIRKGENVRVVFTNATMMEHPMHLHGHFFRVINKQGAYAPLKHTFNINAMNTQVIEFAATEEKDWFLHCHILYHMIGGMATILSYEGTESQVQMKYAKEFRTFKREHGSQYFPWANASFHSQGTFGTVVLSGLKLQLDQDWKWNYKKSYELETKLQYFLDKRQFFSVFAGAEFERTNVRDGKERPMEEENIATLGLNYTLPFFINAEGRIDHRGNFRFQLRREDLPLTTRTRLDVYWNTDEEYGVELRYIVAKYLALSANYDRDYGWGAGISFVY